MEERPVEKQGEIVQREDAENTASVKGADLGPVAGVGLEQDGCNEKAGEHEEEIDSGLAHGNGKRKREKTRLHRVKEHHQQGGDGTHTVKLWVVPVLRTHQPLGGTFAGTAGLGSELTRPCRFHRKWVEEKTEIRERSSGRRRLGGGGWLGFVVEHLVKEMADGVEEVVSAGRCRRRRGGGCGASAGGRARG